MEPFNRVEDVDLCARCGGRCCKTSPGRYDPSECFGPDGFDRAKARDLIDSGRASIVVGLVGALNSPLAPVFALRQRGRGKKELEFFSSDVECDALKADGCSFALEDRPFECAAIVPSTTKCALPHNKQMEDLWASYQRELYVLIEEYADCEWSEEFNRQLADKRSNSPFKRNVQKQISKHGLTTSPTEIALIAGLAKSIE